MMMMSVQSMIDMTRIVIVLAFSKMRMMMVSVMQRMIVMAEEQVSLVTMAIHVQLEMYMIQIVTVRVLSLMRIMMESVRLRMMMIMIHVSQTVMIASATMVRKRNVRY